MPSEGPLAEWEKELLKSGKMKKKSEYAEQRALKYQTELMTELSRVQKTDFLEDELMVWAFGVEAYNELLLMFDYFKWPKGNHPLTLFGFTCWIDQKLPKWCFTMRSKNVSTPGIPLKDLLQSTSDPLPYKAVWIEPQKWWVITCQGYKFKITQELAQKSGLPLDKLVKKELYKLMFNGKVQGDGSVG